MADETILKYLVFLTQLKITASKKKLYLTVFPSFGIDIKSYDIEVCHRIGKSRNSAKKTTVRFSNRKFAKQALYNRKKLKSTGKSTLGLTNDVFINENLTPMNNRTAYNCRKLKHQNLISKRIPLMVWYT